MNIEKIKKQDPLAQSADIVVTDSLKNLFKKVVNHKWQINYEKDI